MTPRKVMILGLIILGCWILLAGCQQTPEETIVPANPTAVPVEPTAVPVEPTTEAVAEPTTLTVCATLAVGLDNGWDKTFYESFLRVQQEAPYGLQIADLKYTEGLLGDDAKAAMDNFAKSGCDIIWTHGGFNDEVKALRDKYPDVMFVEVGSGVSDYGGNDYHFWHRCFEAGYLMGRIAGNMTESGVIGAVGNYPAPEVNDIINAFFAGAKSVKPELKQKAAFINSWWDPPQAMEATNAQINVGATHVLEIAESFEPCVDAGIYCYGPYIDYSEYYPDNALASFIGIWDPPIKWVIDQWYQTKTSGEPFDAPEEPTFSMVNGACDVKINESLMSKIPSSVLDDFNSTKEQIINGQFTVPFNQEVPVSDSD